MSQQASETTRVFCARREGRQQIQTLFSVSCEDLLFVGFLNRGLG